MSAAVDDLRTKGLAELRDSGAAPETISAFTAALDKDGDALRARNILLGQWATMNDRVAAANKDAMDQALALGGAEAGLAGVPRRRRPNRCSCRPSARRKLADRYADLGEGVIVDGGVERRRAPER